MLLLRQVLSRKGKLAERFGTYRRDRNDCYESFSAHNAAVTVAIFAPYSTTSLRGYRKGVQVRASRRAPSATRASALPRGACVAQDSAEGEVLLSADYEGHIKVFVNRAPSVDDAAAKSSDEDGRGAHTDDEEFGEANAARARAQPR